MKNGLKGEYIFNIHIQNPVTWSPDFQCFNYLNNTMNVRY